MREVGDRLSWIWFLHPFVPLLRQVQLSGEAVVSLGGANLVHDWFHNGVPEGGGGLVAWLGMEAAHALLHLPGTVIAWPTYVTDT